MKLSLQPAGKLAPALGVSKCSEAAVTAKNVMIAFKIVPFTLIQGLFVLCP